MVTTFHKEPPLHILTGNLARRTGRSLHPTLLTISNKRTCRRPFILLPLQHHRASEQDRGQQHSGSAPVTDSIHTELALQSSRNEWADEGEDGDARPHHTGPLPNVAVTFGRNEVRHA